MTGELSVEHIPDLTVPDLQDSPLEVLQAAGVLTRRERAQVGDLRHRKSMRGDLSVEHIPDLAVPDLQVSLEVLQAAGR